MVLLRRYICYLLVALFLHMLCSCSDNYFLNDEEEKEYVEIVPTLLKKSSRSGIADVLNEFYVTAYEGILSRGDNIHYTYDGSAWNADYAIVWPSKKKTISFWGLSQPLSDGRGITNSYIYDDEQYFTFTCDPADSHDLLYASNLKTTKAKENGKVSLGFTYSLAYPYFTAVQAIDDVTIIIDSVTVHNLYSTATLKFDKTYNSVAEWTVIDTQFATYGQKLSSPVTLNPNKRSSVKISDKWMWIPQLPNEWQTAEGAPISIQDADALHQCYVEVHCQIIKDGAYLWGAPAGNNEYEPVFFPFGTNFETQGYQKAIKLKFNGGFLADGTPWKPHDLSGDFTISQWITQDVFVYPWEEEEPEDLEF